MKRTNPKKDVVIVGLGWTGSILGMELANQGLDIIALERGPEQNTVPDFQYPKVIDELKYGIRLNFAQKPKNSTLTIRRSLDETALPYRVLGSFLPGNGERCRWCWYALERSYMATTGRGNEAA